MPEPEKKVALVDIDGVLILEDKETGKKKLNPAMVKKLKDENPDEIFLFTQRFMGMQQTALQTLSSATQSLPTDSINTTQELMTELQKELGGVKINVSTSLDPIFGVDQYPQLSDYENRIQASMSAGRYYAPGSQDSTQFKQEAAAEIERVRERRHLPENQREGIIPEGKVEHYRYVVQKQIENGNQCTLKYFEDSLPNLVEIMDASQEKGWGNLPVPTCQLVIDKHIINPKTTQEIIQDYKIKSKQYEENKKNGSIKTKEPFHKMYIRHNKESIIQKNQQENVKINQIESLNQYIEKREAKQTSTKSNYSSFLPWLLRSKSRHADTKIAAAKKAKNILEYDKSSGGPKPAALTSSELRALKHDNLKKACGRDTLLKVSAHSQGVNKTTIPASPNAPASPSASALSRGMKP